MGPGRSERAAAVRTAGSESFDAVLRGVGESGEEPAVDAADRRAVPATAVLRQPADDGLAGIAKDTHVNRKRVQRLMRPMGLVAIYPKPHLSSGSKEHKVYPYLLRNVAVVRPNQVWATDITYVRMAQGSCTWWRSWTGTAAT